MIEYICIGILVVAATLYRFLYVRERNKAKDLYVENIEIRIENQKLVRDIERVISGDIDTINIYTHE